MWRSVLGVVVGAILWMAGFFALARLLFIPWPAYGEKARAWMRQGVFEFTSPMACFNLLFWALAACAAGAVAMTIAKHRGAVWVLAVLLTGYLALMHLVLYWPRFPWWYNLGVVLPALPAVLLGGRLASRPALRA
jgi:hypothetical protein